MTKENGSFPVNALTIAVIVTLVVFGFVGSSLWTRHNLLAQVLSENLALEESAGRVARLDEVLTMEARMAAATGDPTWMERYRLHERQLGEQIRLFVARSSCIEGLKPVTEAVEAANVRLVGIEREALRLVEQGRGAEALAILVSPAYEKEKAAYSAGIKAVEGAVRDQSQGERAAVNTRLYAAGQIALASFCVLLIAWLYLLIQVRRHVARREAAERALKAAHDKLERRVDERTRELTDSNRRLMQEVEERARVARTLREKTTELERSNAELERFAYVASHDLQEPLRMVASYTRLLAHRYRDKLDSDAADFIDYAEEGAVRMQRLLSDLLAYSRLTTRARPFEDVDTGQVVAEVLNNLRMSLEETGGRVVHNGLPVIRADRMQILQVFQNLIGNAIKFHGDGPPEVHVGARRDNGLWVFEVRDRGIGIEPAYHDRIFDIFQRLHDRKTYPGTGIGLSIAKKIVERHGGRIWVESAPGEGTTFHFTVPATAALVEPVVGTDPRD